MRFPQILKRHESTETLTATPKTEKNRRCTARKKADAPPGNQVSRHCTTGPAAHAAGGPLRPVSSSSGAPERSRGSAGRSGGSRGWRAGPGRTEVLELVGEEVNKHLGAPMKQGSHIKSKRCPALKRIEIYQDTLQVRSSKSTVQVAKRLQLNQMRGDVQLPGFRMVLVALGF